MNHKKELLKSLWVLSSVTRESNIEGSETPVRGARRSSWGGGLPGLSVQGWKLTYQIEASFFLVDSALT